MCPKKSNDIYDFCRFFMAAGEFTQLGAPSAPKCLEPHFSLKLTANVPENRQNPKKERIVFQPSIFRCENVSFRKGTSTKCFVDFFTEKTHLRNNNPKKHNLFPRFSRDFTLIRSGVFQIFGMLTIQLTKNNRSPEGRFVFFFRSGKTGNRSL